MAASDPAMAVPTPAGALQGVAAFSWDGSVWQPAGRAGPAVATPTGVLQGVAPFTWDGSAWQPVGRAGPGVATPSGVLDGVAVYTWSGSAWTPAGGQPAPSTPSGSLRGVAAFNWDGSAWQPAAQAGPSVATPYGVLAGVAMFNWSGTAWAAASAGPPGVSLDLSFMSPGTLDPRITFTRASTGTYFDAAGVMQTSAYNMLGDFTTFTTSSSTMTPASGVAPDGTNTMIRLTEVAATAPHFIFRLTPIISGSTYNYSIFAKAAENRYLQLTVDDGSSNIVFANFDLQTGTISRALGSIGTPVIGTASIQPFGNGIYRCSISGAVVTANLRTNTILIPAAGSSFAFGYAGNTANGLLIWGPQLEIGSAPTSYIPTTTVANGAPRWDYNPVTHALNGLLIEEARTNLQFPSINWNANATVSSTVDGVVQNSAVAPDGTTTAMLYIPSGASAVHQSFTTYIGAITTTYTHSCYVKAAGYSYGTLGLENTGFGANATVIAFDLTNGTIANTSGPGTGTIQAVGNGWYRIAVIATSLSGGAPYVPSLRVYDTLAHAIAYGAYVGNMTSGMLMWGKVVEAGAFATSYIPTTAAAATRALDAVSMTGTNFSSWWNQSAGTYQAEFAMANPVITGTQGGVFRVDDGTNNNVAVSFISSAQQEFTTGTVGSVVQINIAIGGSQPLNTVAKSAIAYTTTAPSWRGAANGAVSIAAGTVVAASQTRMMLGTSFASGNAWMLNGWVRRVRYWPRALTNAELQSVTT